jgi:hypothetical protein
MAAAVPSDSAAGAAARPKSKIHHRDTEGTEKKIETADERR